MSDHTPGPWWLSDYDWYVRATCNQGIKWRVAEVMEVLPEDEQAEANAHLIAAAPDMLAALIAERDWKTDIERARAADMRHAAIAKATGKEVQP